MAVERKRGESATMIGVAFMALAALAPSYERAPRGEDALRTEVMRNHNDARARAGVAPLAWDQTLAAHAAIYARTLAAGGEFTHDKTPGRRHVEGENLWEGTRGLFSYDVMLGMMTREARWFRPGRYPDVSATGNWSDVGHYSQIIWPATTAVGCAVATGPHLDALVCRYSPPGNKDGVWVR